VFAPVFNKMALDILNEKSGRTQGSPLRESKVGT
jgi:hypothetical protein